MGQIGKPLRRIEPMEVPGERDFPLKEPVKAPEREREPERVPEKVGAFYDFMNASDWRWAGWLASNTATTSATLTRGMLRGVFTDA